MVEQFFTFLQALITRIIMIRHRDESRQLRGRATQLSTYLHCEWFALPDGDSRIICDQFTSHICTLRLHSFVLLNPLTPNDPYSGRTAPLTSKRCILYIYSTNTGTDYFKHGIYFRFSFLFKMQFVS